MDEEKNPPLKKKLIYFECNYNEKGEKEGEHKEYDNNGKLIYYAIYFGDVLLKSISYDCNGFITDKILIINSTRINNWINLYKIQKFDLNYNVSAEGEFYFIKSEEPHIGDPEVKIGEWKYLRGGK